MKTLYRKEGESRNHTLYVQPGTQFPDNPDFNQDLGGPIMFTIRFVDGKAEDVHPEVAQFCIDKGYAVDYPTAGPPPPAVSPWELDLPREQRIRWLDLTAKARAR